MQSFLTTSIVGGSDAGHIFQDLHARAPDGNFVVNVRGHHHQLDLNHPIQEISVSSGTVVDGISVTYRFTNGGEQTITHGSEFEHAVTVTIADNERLVGVFGRAGHHSYFEHNLIHSIGFAIFDESKQTVRTAGPFGGHSASNEGTVFYCSDPIAFGGFADNGKDTRGLSGLFFFKEVGK